MTQGWERFWSKVAKSSGCWVWQGCKDKQGYGWFHLPTRKMVYAHRQVWEWQNGAPRRFVLHKCDNPSCVNPDHLYEGDHADNMKDRSERGRTCSGDRHWAKTADLRGEQNGRSKLTAEDVIKLRSLAASGVKQQAIADQFGISNQLTSRIIARKAWGHV